MPRVVPLIEGPYFVYDDAPVLFSRRSGIGPLEIVWDTCILIDYLDHGRAMWEGEPGDLEAADEDYLAELQALHIVINLWTRRDIRMIVLERSIADAKRALDPARRQAREHAIDEIGAALGLDRWAEDEEAEVLQAIPPPRGSLRAALAQVPAGADRELVADAAACRAHVFLTRDRGTLAAAPAVHEHGLWIASPLDLLEELSANGAILAIMRPETMYWPLPDLQRISHLLQALPPEER
jgi:hypothetical protein